MRSVVVSDLHLGASSRADLLRRPEVRAVLVEALRPGDRLVILGDGLELREVPLREAASYADALLAEAAEVLGADGEVVVLAGNHDHGLVGAWVDSRLQQTSPPALGLEHLVEPHEAGPLAEALATAARPARLRLAYPGLHLREDVYAIHGHYADLHTTVPTFERLIAGAMDRWVTPLPGPRATPDDYEAVVAPIYAWMHTLAQRSQHGVVKAGAGASARAWVAMTHTNGWAGRARAAALGVGYAAAVGAINRVGIGPVHRDLSGPALRRGYLHAMHEVVERLGIEAEHVLWGHTHRAGPLPGDDPGEWRSARGTQLWNTGSWVFQPHFIGGAPGTSPYWPGGAVIVEETGPPRPLRLLEGWSREALRPDPA